MSSCLQITAKYIESVRRQTDCKYDLLDCVCRLCQIVHGFILSTVCEIVPKTSDEQILRVCLGFPLV